MLIYFVYHFNHFVFLFLCCCALEGRGEVEWQGRTSWNQLATGGDAPPARYGHSLVVLPTPSGDASKDGGPAVILFGGSNQVRCCLSQTSPH
jgi:hypothetical protein